MKILVASSAPPDGGAGISAAARSTSLALAESGHEIHYASPTPRDPAFFEHPSIQHVPTDREADPIESARRLWVHAREQGLEGAINNDNPVLQSIAPALEMPLVVICHMDRRIVASLCRHQLEWIDHLVCISNDMLTTMTRRYGFDLCRCVLVSNGVHDPGPRPARPPTPSNPLRLVFSGVWDVHKGGPRLLSSLERSPAEWSGTRVDWFGDAPAHIRARLERTGVVDYHGHRPQAEFLAALEAADVLLFPSAKEGCPMTVLEAMSLGVVPIVADGVGAMRWIVGNGKDGFVVPLDRWAALLPPLVRYLAERRELVPQIGMQSRETYLDRFQAHHAAEPLVRLLSRPTVDRSHRPESIEVLSWHRPVPAPGRRNGLMNRIRFRTGWLPRAGRVQIESVGPNA